MLTRAQAKKASTNSTLASQQKGGSERILKPQANVAFRAPGKVQSKTNSNNLHKSQLKTDLDELPKSQTKDLTNSEPKKQNVPDEKPTLPSPSSNVKSSGPNVKSSGPWLTKKPSFQLELTNAQNSLSKDHDSLNSISQQLIFPSIPSTTFPTSSSSSSSFPSTITSNPLPFTPTTPPSPPILILPHTPHQLSQAPTPTPIKPSTSSKTSNLNSSEILDEILDSSLENLSFFDVDNNFWSYNPGQSSLTLQGTRTADPNTPMEEDSSSENLDIMSDDGGGNDDDDDDKKGLDKPDNEDQSQKNHKKAPEKQKSDLDSLTFRKKFKILKSYFEDTIFDHIKDSAFTSSFDPKFSKLQRDIAIFECGMKGVFPKAWTEALQDALKLNSNKKYKKARKHEHDSFETLKQFKLRQKKIIAKCVSSSHGVSKKKTKTKADLQKETKKTKTSKPSKKS